MDQFIQKNYDLNIIIPQKFLRFKRKKTIKIHYGQAKPIDFIEFMRLSSPDDAFVWVLNFVKRHTKGLKKSEYNHIIAQAESFNSVLHDTFWKRKPIIVIPDPEDDGSSKDAPYSSSISFLAKELCETPHNLIHNYTLEELDYLSEGITRNINTQSDKGKQRNKLKAIQQSSQNMFNKKKDMIDNFLKD